MQFRHAAKSHQFGIMSGRKNLVGIVYAPQVSDIIFLCISKVNPTTMLDIVLDA